MCVMFVIIFFFSSRRRHTRCLSDWSSDVCSSDLGNHGDEWEGQIGLGNLIRALQPKDIKGRLVILPSANFPAAMEGRRTSPIDEGNLNRSFPGDAEGTITQQIAYFIEHSLLPGFDYSFDFHSGGS